MSVRLQDCACYPSVVAKQRLGENVDSAKNRRKNGRLVQRVVSYAVRVVSKERGRRGYGWETLVLCQYNYNNINTSDEAVNTITYSNICVRSCTGLQLRQERR